jgi:Cu(I)/Ag(I) efflux system membrane fusion protein
MKNNKSIINIIKEHIKLISIALAIGLILGIIIVKITNQHINTSTTHVDESTHQHIDELTNEVWTCSMHPQIRQDKPGKCPICAMDLIPLITASSDGDDVNPNEL